MKCIIHEAYGFSTRASCAACIIILRKKSSTSKHRKLEICTSKFLITSSTSSWGPFFGASVFTMMWYMLLPRKFGSLTWRISALSSSALIRSGLRSIFRSLVFTRSCKCSLCSSVLGTRIGQRSLNALRNSSAHHGYYVHIYKGSSWRMFSVCLGAHVTVVVQVIIVILVGLFCYFFSGINLDARQLKSKLSRLS